MTPAVGENSDTPPSESSAIYTGPSEENGDIRGVTDADGIFTFTDVPPGHYFLIVWAPYTWVLATESDVDFAPYRITVETNQQINLGVVNVPWP
jgi:hypothetical protein